MTSFLFLFFLLFQGQLFAGLSWAQRPDHDHECTPKSCSDYGPEIRFPFWLKDRQPDHCGYPGFELYCSPNNHTLLELPFLWTVSVWEIDYESQAVNIYIDDDAQSCFLGQPPNLNASSTTSPFHFSSSSYPPDQTYTASLFSCPPSSTNQYLGSSSSSYYYYSMSPITCLSSRDRTVYVVDNDNFIFQLPLLSCTKMYTIPSFLYYAYRYGYEYGPYGNYNRLSWSKPSCGKCVAKGQNCRLTRNNSSSREHETECFGIPNPPITAFTGGERETKSPMVTSKMKSLIVAGAILGMFLLLVVVIGICFVHRSKISKKEDQVKVERFLEDYRALKPTRYTYAEVKKITNKFKDKLGQGGYGTVYKGELSNEVHVAAKILNNSKGEGEEFINEVGTIGRIHHINVVRLVGYCADGFRRALVYEYLPNDSLEKFISSDQAKHSIGWEKLQNIALGIAKGIEYLHQGCDQRILHFDIKPHNILLDHNFNPKIADFGLAKLCSKEQSAVSMTAARGTIGYIAPEVFSRNFGNVSYKSDVYSFGMLLLEMIGGRKNTGVTVQNTSEVYFPEWIYNNLSHGEELGIEIEEDGDAKIVKKIAIVGLWCIQWYPGDRPSMKVVIQMLEGDVATLAMPPNPFATTNAMTAKGTTGGRPFNSTLEVISESE